MAFQRPTLAELVTRIESDLVTRLELDSSAVLRRAFVYVLARVIAAAVHLLHGHLAFLADQLFPDTSTADFLVRQARLYGLARLPATYAAGNVSVTGTNGTTIPAGTELQRSDGTAYTVDALVTIAAGVGTLAVTAAVAGADGAADVGTVLTFLSPLVGVSSTGTVASGGLSGAADEETDDELRARVIERMSAPPHGGSEADYVAWAKAVSGVTRAWAAGEELGPGTVSVRFVRDNDGTGADIIPDSGEVADVQTAIDAVRPVTAAVTVVAPVAVDLDLTIHIASADLPTSKAAVEAELNDLLRRDVSPGCTLKLSQIRMAVGLAVGVTDYVVTLPAADVVYTTGQIPVLGTITWT